MGLGAVGWLVGPWLGVVLFAVEASGVEELLYVDFSAFGCEK